MSEKKRKMGQKNSKISLLMIEDEQAIRDMLRFSIPPEEFQLEEAANTEEAMECLRRKVPHLIILDWMLPGKHGLHFLTWLRKEPLYENIPVIMLTAKAEQDSKIKALGIGADDYMVKPFSVGELLARVRAILRRGLMVSMDHEIKMKKLVCNTSKKKLSIDGEVLPLTAQEYRMLYFFLTHPKKVYSREQLLNHVWGQECYFDDRAVDAQIKRIRQKLKPFGYDEYLKTERGVGYYFDMEEDPHGE